MPLAVVVADVLTARIAADGSFLPCSSIRFKPFMKRESLLKLR
jgi:hypothetical protein